MAERLLDVVSIFGDKLSFRIPHEWVEGDDGDDTYLYHAPNTDSGWLRVSLITVNAADPKERLKELFPLTETFFVSEERGNRVQPSEGKSRHEPDAYVYSWTVANAVEPGRIFEAVFSYTILAEKINESETRKTVELVEELVSEARFSNGPQ